MSNLSIRRYPANEKLDPRWVMVALAVVLGVMAAALLWPVEPSAPAVAAITAASTQAGPRPQAIPATRDRGAAPVAAAVASTIAPAVAPAVAPETEGEQEDNHPPTF